MRNVAIACQGGGSHTAFTAGVLRTLLSSEKYGKDFRIAALTGTSGGALCAGIAWSKLLSNKTRLTASDYKEQGEQAAKALRDFWMDLACDSVRPTTDNELYLAPWRRRPFDLMDAVCNEEMVDAARMNLFQEQQCQLLSRLTRSRMMELLRRHVSVPHVKEMKNGHPLLRIGATDILKGHSEPIRVEDYGPQELPLILLASASIPPIFAPTKLDGAFYWDGLYSHNPPIECLSHIKDDDKRQKTPDEIWVIQINPETRAKPPTNAIELVDRRNEIMGNLSLAAELYHMDSINHLIQKHRKLRPALAKIGYRPITLRVVTLKRDNLDYASKLDRSREQIESLMKLGEDQAWDFFDKKSEWTMGDEWGVHNASADPQRIGQNRHAIEAHHREAGKEPGYRWCSSWCPASGWCNSCPGLGTALERSFNWGQKYLEADVGA